jgi:hypothetical protein
MGNRALDDRIGQESTMQTRSLLGPEAKTERADCMTKDGSFGGGLAWRLYMSLLALTCKFLVQNFDAVVKFRV